MKDNKNINSNLNEGKKIPIKSLLGTFIMLLIVVVGGTFAWYTYQSNKTALVLNIGDLNDSRVIIKPYQINDIMVPVNNYTSGVNSQISVINENSDSVEITFFYRINELDSDLINNGLKYTIVSSDTKDGNYTEVMTGAFTTVGSSTEFDIFNVEVPASTTIYYKIYLWLDTNFGDQSSIQNLNINIELNARFGDDLTDSTAPTCTISVTAGSIDLIASYSDNVGVTGYYFGTVEPSSSTSFTSMTSSTSGTITGTVSSTGTHYFGFKDAAGNVGYCSKEIISASSSCVCGYYHSGYCATGVNATYCSETCPYSTKLSSAYCAE